MGTLITNGIRITVETAYQANHSLPTNHNFLFAYRITIENTSDHKVQLRRRHWYIHNAYGIIREVEGEGVIGEKPVLNPGEDFQYISSCPLDTEIGLMRGTYQMVRLEDGKLFRVAIPEFIMVVPFKEN